MDRETVRRKVKRVRDYAKFMVVWNGKIHFSTIDYPSSNLYALPMGIRRVAQPKYKCRSSDSMDDAYFICGLFNKQWCA